MSEDNIVDLEAARQRRLELRYAPPHDGDELCASAGNPLWDALDALATGTAADP